MLYKVFLSASQSPTSSQFVAVFTLYLLKAEMQCFYCVDKYSLNSEMKPSQFFFPCAGSELRFLQLGSWCSDIAEQRVKKQSIRPYCLFLLSSAPRKYTFQPISKESGKRHLIIVTTFKQRLNRDIAYFGGLS